MQTMKGEIRTQTACLLILCIIAVGWALYVLSPVLIPFVLAIFFTAALLPVIDFLTKVLHMPRSVALAIAGLLGCLVLGMFALVFEFTFDQMRTNLDVYQKQLTNLIDWLIESLALERFGFDPAEVRRALFQDPQNTVASALRSTFGSIMNLISNGVTVLIFMLFMLIGKHSTKISPDGLVADIQSQVKRYILTMFFISALTAVLVGVSLRILGVDFVLMFGFFVFLLNFIPYIGSIIATLLPIPVAFLDPELGMAGKIMVIAIPGTIQFVIGNILAPKIMGDYLELHPVVVLISLVFFGQIWGIVGMFLAAPITGVLKIAFLRMEYTRPIAGLFDGRLDMFEGNHKADVLRE